MNPDKRAAENAHYGKLLPRGRRTPPVEWLLAGGCRSGRTGPPDKRGTPNRVMGSNPIPPAATPGNDRTPRVSGGFTSRARRNQRALLTDLQPIRCH